ncbi:MAG: suppressor of fused domain protein [Planctomycetota bacterium]|nr:suppressor of fused domain protein [Planctomycetota bacterium]MDA1213525.1 suppressor of fused domain protein [Planctomycetota bacterium]
MTSDDERDDDFEDDDYDDFDDDGDDIEDDAETEPLSEEEQALAEEWYERKTALMEQTLGTEHDMVMHAIIPYELGGGLDLYYFPNGIPGTGVATKELSTFPDSGSNNAVYLTYELLMFTRHALSLDDASDEKTPFGKAHHNINAILNLIAPYSEDAELNPRETCEFPDDMETVGGKCLIFDGYTPYADEDDPQGEMEDFGLLLLIEIFRSEMEFAREHGGAELIEKLKAAGHYPYSDMDRKPVV